VFQPNFIGYSGVESLTQQNNVVTASTDGFGKTRSEVLVEKKGESA
jgi:hypothetical protein